MAKKSSTNQKLHNPEAHERINYLFSISTILIHQSYQDNLVKRFPELKYFSKALVKKELADSIALSQFYVKTLREITRKSVIRL